jgi:NADPH-dependent ferric siderophore reductase
MKELLYGLERMLFKKTIISKIERLNSSFIYMELQGEELKGSKPNLGDFFQISLGALKARSYTPIEWNSELGSLSFLYFCHGEGLADQWMKSAKLGDECLVFGPRKSMDSKKIQDDMVFIGDETTIGFAASLVLSSIRMKFYFEVDQVEATQEALAYFGIKAQVTSKGTPQLPSAESGAIISGNAHRVRELRSQFKGSIGVPYWTPGKEGK